MTLDIKNMSEEDKLFNFVSRLQAWAQTKLRRLKVEKVRMPSQSRRGRQLHLEGVGLLPLIITPCPDEVHSTCNCRGTYVHQVPL